MARAILRAQQERQLRRLEPDAGVQRAGAESLLKEGTTAQRISAAASLGNLRFLCSFEPLLNALARESEPGFGDRRVKTAILQALDNVGSEHAGQTALRTGHEQLRGFINAHLSDPELVGKAMKALAWTGNRAESIHDADDIKKAARKAGYKSTASAASAAYFSRI